MAQVKKFNTGGSVQKMKYGNIIKNGTTYEMTEESMKRLEQHIAAADPDVQQSLANDWKLLMSGQDVAIDTMANQRSTVPTDFTKGQLRRLSKDKPVESKYHARHKTDINAYNRATKYLGEFNFSAEPSQTPKTKLGPGSSAFEYTTNDDGTRSYRSLPNSDEIKLFDDIAAYLNGNEDYRSKYDVSGWSGFSDLDNWYKGLMTPTIFMQNLRRKILKGEALTADEEDYLATIGLTQNFATNDKVEQQKKEAEEKVIRDKAWTRFNEGNLWNDSLRDKQIVYNAEKDEYGIDSRYMPQLPSDTYGYYFNDDFTSWNPNHSWLNGKLYFGDKWYSGAELSDPTSDLYKLLNSPQYDYYNKNKRGDFQGADSIIKTYWNGYFIPVKSDSTSNYMGSFYKNPHLYYVETDYSLPETTYNGAVIDDSYNIFRYMDDRDTPDAIGRRQERITITDAYGNPVKLDGYVMNHDIPTYDVNQFSKLYDRSTKEENQYVNYTTRMSTDPNNEYYNRYADTPGKDINGDTFIEGWIDPMKRDVNVAISTVLGGTEGLVFPNMPLDVYEALKDADFISKINHNRDAMETFKKFVQGKIELTANDLIALGINSETAPYVKDYFIKYWTDYKNGKISPKKRPVSLNKQGGTLKLQVGGPIKHVGSKQYEIDPKKVTYLSEKLNNPLDSKVINDGTGLSNTDIQEITALALDLGSAIASYIPGVGDAVGIVGGQAANLTRLNLDKKRKAEGLDSKPWKNYFINTGIDLVSLVPVIGDTVNLGSFGTKALTTFKRLYGPVTTSLSALGLYSAKDAVDKLIAGEKLTVEDAQALSAGLQALVGGTYRGVRTFRDSRLAATTAPKVKDIKHEFKFKNGDTEVTKTLDKSDIEKLSAAKGKTAIENELKQIYKDKKGVPEEQIADLVKNTDYKQLGLVYTNKKWYGKDRVSEQKADKPKGTLYYWSHPTKRESDLSSRSVDDIVSAVKSDSDLNNAAGRWAVMTGKAKDLPGEVTGKGKYTTFKLNQNNSKGTTSEASVIRTQNNTSKPDNSNLQNSGTRTSEPEIKPIEENRHFSSEEFNEKFLQYQSFIRGTGNSPSVKQFKNRFKQYAKTEDFKKLAEDNPELVKKMVDEEIANVLSKGTRKANDEARLRSDLEEIKTQNGLKFQKGGIIKAQGGFKPTPLGEIPEWRKPIEIETQYSKDLRDLFEKETTLNPTGMITGSNIGGLRVNKPETKSSDVQSSSETKASGTQTPDMYGQNPYETSSNKSGRFGNLLLTGLGIGEYLSKQMINNRVADKKIEGLRNATILGMRSAPAFTSVARYNNAFAPYKIAAEQLNQYTPPLNSDYMKMASFDYNNKRNVNNTLMQGYIAASQRQDQINDAVAQSLRQRAIEEAEVANYNRGLWAQFEAGKSNIEASKLLTSGTNFGNLLREYRTELDQSAAQMDKINSAKNELIAEKAAEDDYKAKLQERYGAAYKADPNKGTLTIEQWVNTRPEYASEAALLREQLKHNARLDAMSRMTDQVKYGNLFVKSGGKLRSTSDQIRINKHKAFDKVWIDNNKATLKAIENLNKQTYQILMKLLS